jgi:acetyl-CoA synthetase
MKRTSVDAYGTLHDGFSWQVPDQFNIADVCCTRWAAGATTARRVAVAWQHEDGRRGSLSFGQLQAKANRLANVLRGLGVQRGDRVALVLPQRPETAVAHMAVYQLGAVAVPLSMLFGPEALAYRLQDSGALLALADENGIVTLRAVRAECPSLRHVLAVGAAAGQGDADWDLALADARVDQASFRRVLKSASVTLSPSVNETLGDQPSSSRARVMSG